MSSFISVSGVRQCDVFGNLVVVRGSYAAGLPVPAMSAGCGIIYLLFPGWARCRCCVSGSYWVSGGRDVCFVDKFLAVCVPTSTLELNIHNVDIVCIYLHTRMLEKNLGSE